MKFFKDWAHYRDHNEGDKALRVCRATRQAEDKRE